MTGGIRLFVRDGALRYRAPERAMTPAIRAAIAARRGDLVSLCQAFGEVTVTRERATKGPRPDGYQPLPVGVRESTLDREVTNEWQRACRRGRP